MMKRNIVLVGMMGSGKSHIGRKLAQCLGWQFVDTDRRIERAVGMTIAEFFASSGEKVFANEKSISCSKSAAITKLSFPLAAIFP